MCISKWPGHRMNLTVANFHLHSKCLCVQAEDIWSVLFLSLTVNYRAALAFFFTYLLGVHVCYLFLF